MSFYRAVAIFALILAAKAESETCSENCEEWGGKRSADKKALIREN